jgi:flagellin
MTVINTNNAATLAANALTKNERAMSQAMERLSTGVRINSAGDDAAGLAISSRMTSQINGLDMAVRNANDAVSMVNTADGALIEVSNMLGRMRELAVQSASGTNSTTDRAALNTEYVALLNEVGRVSENTQWNGMNLLDDSPGSSGTVSFQIGANASQTVSTVFGDIGAQQSISNAGTTANAHAITVGGSSTDGISTGDIITVGITDAADSTTGYMQFTMSADNVTDIYDTTAAATLGSTVTFNSIVYTLTSSTTAGTLALTGASGTSTLHNLTVSRGIHAAVADNDVLTTTKANSAITALDTAIDAINTQRSVFGAAVNRLEYAADNLANVSQNTSASRSRILDADYASETTELARTQIIQQAGTAMLSQANQQAQSVLALLK